MQFEVWIPEITLHRDGPHLLNWSVIKRHGQRSYEWACVCQLTKGLWLNWPRHHSVKAWGIRGTLWHLRSPSYLRTIWRVGGSAVIEGLQSQNRPITHGVPQWSILGTRARGAEMTGAIMPNLCAPFTLYNFWEAYPPSVYSYEEVVTFYAIWSLDTRDHITPRWPSFA